MRSVKVKVKKKKHNNYDSVVYAYIATIKDQMENYLQSDMVYYTGKYKTIVTEILKRSEILRAKYEKKGYVTNSQKERSVDYANRFYRESKENREKTPLIKIIDDDLKYIPMIDVFTSSLEKYIDEHEKKIDTELLREIQIFSKYCRRFLINFVKLATDEER